MGWISIRSERRREQSRKDGNNAVRLTLLAVCSRALMFEIVLPLNAFLDIPLITSIPILPYTNHRAILIH